MKILITGSSGLIGSSLWDFLVAKNEHEVLRLIRTHPQTHTEFEWDPMAKEMDSTPFEGVDCVIHLAGENVAEGRWNAARKKEDL